EHMGLRVIAEHPYRIEAEARIAYIQDFEVEADGSADVSTLGPAFETACARIWAGDAESDGFNRLILGAGLDWRQVSMLRGYGQYLQQVGVPLSQAYVDDSFARYPLLAELILELYEARFDPRTGNESKA